MTDNRRILPPLVIDMEKTVRSRTDTKVPAFQRYASQVDKQKAKEEEADMRKRLDHPSYLAGGEVTGLKSGAIRVRPTAQKSYTADEVTVARLLKGMTPEKANEFLKAISSLYTTPGALSAKRSGGYQGVKLMQDIDKRQAGKPNLITPKVMGAAKPTKPTEEKEAYSMGGAEKSISDMCDDIMAKSSKDIDTRITQAQAKYERRRPAREARLAQEKKHREGAKRAMEHFRSKAETPEEAFGGKGGSEDED